MARRNWTDKELTIAFALYCQIPFGKIHKGNAAIIDATELIDRTPSALAMKMLNFASLDPKIIESGRAGLGNASSADRRIWEEFNENWEQAVEKSQEYLGIPKVEEADEQEYEITSVTGTAEFRRKQAFFRNAVLAGYRSICCISGLNDPQLLVASHIIPWSKSERDRLNPSNGVCLSVLYDKTFDLGLITITPKFEVVVSQELRKNATDEFSRKNLHGVHGRKIDLPERFLPSERFLDYHNNNIFRN